jgi:hypothetical protein
MNENKAVYRAIATVSGELAKDGVAKNRKNAAQGYNFRGIDDVYNALAPLLSKHGLVVLPRYTERLVIEKINSKGNTVFYVTVKGEFDFVAAEDGSCHTVVTYGEAMDSSDKATNKAMSAAYKYAAFQAFSIPTEGDNDADSSHHELPSAVKIFESLKKEVLAFTTREAVNAWGVANAGKFKLLPAEIKGEIEKICRSHRDSLPESKAAPDSQPPAS